MSCGRRGVSGHVMLVLLLGCEAPSSVVAVANETALDDDPGYISHQGRLLLGFTRPDVRRFVFPASEGSVRVDETGRLLTAARGTDVVGLEFSATDGAVMRIADALAPESAKKLWQYALEQRDRDTGTWVDACADPPSLMPPPWTGPVLAFAIPGWWRTSGMYVDDPAEAGFACQGGVVAKCISWGYTPTNSPGTTTGDGVSSDASGPDMLLACTRMARADYCAVGVSNTLDGTPIHVHNVFKTTLFDPPRSDLAFEAVWPGDAQPPGDRSDDSAGQPALCLSKLRWSTLPLGGGCPLHLPDPRVPTDPANPSHAHFCEGDSAVDLEMRGALVAVDSSYLDAGLYTWTDTATDARFTTASLLPGQSGELPTWRTDAPPGLVFPQNGQSLHFEGTLLNLDAASLGQALDVSTMRLLKSFRCDDDYVTTTAISGRECSQIADEGLLYPPNAPQRAKLRRWWLPRIQRSHTTTTSPTTMISDGWELVEVVGGMLRADMAVNVRWDDVPGATYSLDVQTQDGHWIAPCIDATTLGSATTATIDGSCPAASQLPLRSSDIVAFRTNYAGISGTGSTVAAHDGVSSDVYLEIPDGRPTALMLSWTDLGPRTRYAVDLRIDGTWQTCASDRHVANDNALVLPGRCPEGSPSMLDHVEQVRVCAAPDGNWGRRSCSTAPRVDRSPWLQLTLSQ